MAAQPAAWTDAWYWKVAMAAIPVGLGVYIKFQVDRYRLIKIILADLYHRRKRLQEVHDYLSRDDHYWLRALQRLEDYPINIREDVSVVPEIMKQLLLLNTGRARKLLRFYWVYNHTEGLREALFESIRVRMNTTLSAQTVKIFDLQRQRIVTATEAMSRGLALIDVNRIASLDRLPEDYNTQSTAQAADQVNVTLGR